MPVKKIKKAIFPVGGLGTRFLPATKAIPKEMLPVANKPLIQYAFEEAVQAGIEEFIFITGRNKSAINNHFDHAFELQTVLSEQEKHTILAQVVDWTPQAGQIIFIPQRQPLGLGHAIWCARNLIGDEPFAILLADEMVLAPQGALSQMVQVYPHDKANMLAIAKVANDKVSAYGIIEPEENSNPPLMRLTNMVEKPTVTEAPSQFSITGRYILQPEIFSHLAKTKQTSGGEIQLTDAMRAMLPSADFYGFAFSGQRFDCGNPLGFIEANIAYALEQKYLTENMQAILKKYQ